MRRMSSLMVLAAALVPLVGAVPTARVKEPNAVFAFDVLNGGKRVKAVLFDRLRQKPLENMDVTLDAPASDDGTNDIVQFSPGSKKVYVRSTRRMPDTGADEEIDYQTSIVGDGFAWKDPVEIFSCQQCSVGGWIVHPTEPKLYLSLASELENNDDEFRAAKLIEITLAPVRRTRVITRIPYTSELRITPDGKSLYTFGVAKNSRQAYGELVTVGLSERKRSKKVVNLPESDAFLKPVQSSTSNVSPDALEIAYHFGIMDLRGGATEILDVSNGGSPADPVIGWSRSSRKLLFQLQTEVGENDLQVVYDRTDKHGHEWILPIRYAEFLQWAPSETAILYDRFGDIGYYDLKKREWVHVFDAGTNLTGGAAWATLPTKRVPKR